MTRLTPQKFADTFRCSVVRNCDNPSETKYYACDGFPEPLKRGDGTTTYLVTESRFTFIPSMLIEDSTSSPRKNEVFFPREPYEIS
jgi:hypothetical protein